MAPEIGNRRSVLPSRPVPGAIMQNRLQPIELGAADIAMLIDHDAGDALARRTAHDPRLGGVESEALLHHDGLDIAPEAIDVLREIGVAGEGEIIGIARVIPGALAFDTRP